MWFVLQAIWNARLTEMTPCWSANTQTFSVSSCAVTGGRIGKTLGRTRDTWTACRPCVFCSVASTRRSVRTAMCSLPSYTRTAFHLVKDTHTRMLQNLNIYIIQGDVAHLYHDDWVCSRYGCHGTNVFHDWCNKGGGMCYPVCGMVHIKEPLRERKPAAIYSL